MRETAYYLAVGAVCLMHTIDPDMVLFGGGMIAAGQPFLEHIRAESRKWHSRRQRRAHASNMPCSAAKPASWGSRDAREWLFAR